MGYDIWDGNENVGYFAPSSMWDPFGSSYVHIFPDKKRQYRLPKDPYDEFYDTLNQARHRAKEIVGDGFAYSRR